MPRGIDREAVRRLREQGAQILEVLPAADYDWKHIAGAINLPLKELNRESASRLDSSRPVVTYCNDFQ
jgi:rhodanese-related sulfurtransferase